MHICGNKSTEYLGMLSGVFARGLAHSKRFHVPTEQKGFTYLPGVLLRTEARVMMPSAVDISSLQHIVLERRRICFPGE